MLRRPQRGRPDLDSMKRHELNPLHLRLIGRATKDVLGEDEAAKKTNADVVRRLNAYYDTIGVPKSGQNKSSGLPYYSGLPLKIRAVANWEKAQSFNAHFQHRHLLELEGDETENQLPTASAQGSTEWIDLNRLSQRLKNPWGIRVNEEYPSTLEIPDAPGQQGQQGQGEPDDNPEDEDKDTDEDKDDPDDKVEVIPQTNVPFAGHCNHNNELMVRLLEYILTTAHQIGRQQAITLWPLVQNDHSIIVPPQNMASREPVEVANELLPYIRAIKRNKENRATLNELARILEHGYS